MLVKISGGKYINVNQIIHIDGDGHFREFGYRTITMNSNEYFSINDMDFKKIKKALNG